MNIIDPKNPVFNAIVFYILIICIILIIKPKFMYCYKTKKFKPFGFGDKQTFMSFSVITVGTGILLYMLFLWIEIIFDYLNE
jgi:Ca2+/H+ antiporter